MASKSGGLFGARPAHSSMPGWTVFLLTTALILVSSVSGQASTGQTWTFKEPGRSYMASRPLLEDGGDQHYTLSFRTRQANGLLFHHHIVDLQSSTILLQKYEFFMELKDGKIHIGFIVNHFHDFKTIGVALNNDRWHTVDIRIDAEKKKMLVTLDGAVETETLKAYVWGDAADLLVWSHFQTLFSVGGSKLPDWQDASPFIGCIRDVEHGTVDGVLLPVTFNLTEHVVSGCEDGCMFKNVCNLGRCVNLYNDVRCDCYGTDYEGKFCEKEAATTMTFRGYEWVAFQLYEENNKLFTDHTRISLEFKTEREAGVLLYAVGGTPFHSHVTISLYSGEVHASLSFENDDISFSEGIGLDDGRWHNLTIDHRQDSVFFYLDGKSTEKKVTRGGYYLNLDPFAYIGGGDNFVQTKGLPITQSFVGCLRNVYINEMSVLYEMTTGNHRSRYNGGVSPQYGCVVVDEVPISFPRSSSMLKWSGQERQHSLSVEFKIRTYSTTAIVMFVEVISRMDSSSGFDFGSIQLWIVDKIAVLQFVPVTRNAQYNENVTLPIIISDGTVHDVEVTLLNSKVTLKIDGNSASSSHFHKLMEYTGQVILGYSLRQIEVYHGFVGCMHRIQIQGMRLDPISLIESDAAVGLILDGCQLTDHCSNNNICEHEAECYSDWDGVHCHCHNKHYEGVACHFANYAATCDEYHRMGYRASGVYLIDVDGAGPIDATYVHCQMDKRYTGGVTVVEHNFLTNTTVRAPWLSDIQYHLKYREMSREQLTQLTQTSGKCEQYLKYDCIESPIRLSHKTWFKATNGEIVDYIGSHNSGFCDCPRDSGCGGKNCFCDHADGQVTTDSGYNRERHQLPIMEMTFLHNQKGMGYMTLGPLRCWGSEQQPSDRSITFTKTGSFVRLHPWKSGDFKINFKTHKKNALLLYHSSNVQEEPNIIGELSRENTFSITIRSEYEVQFKFNINGRKLHKTLRLINPLDRGNWHMINIEYDKYNLRLTLDSNKKLIKFPPDTNFPKFNGFLYLGGMSDDMYKKSGEEIVGFTGCMYGFAYNGKAIDLHDSVDHSMNGVSVDCTSSCWPNPCQNGGVCEERWGDYTCTCSDPWAHIGSDCENDLNEDAVTLSGLSSAYLKFDVSSVKDILDGTVVMSFRTFLNEAFLMYVHDEMGNFIQLELSDPHTVAVSFNNVSQIIRDTVTTDGKLNDGEWKQLIAEKYFGFTRLIINGTSKVVEYPRKRIKTYSLNPYYGSINRPRTFISRPAVQPAPYIHAYIGSIKDHTTSVSQLVGCVRGMRIDDYVFRLQDAAKEIGNSSVVAAACETGCHQDSCHHNGVCKEKWKNKQFECNCDDNGFSGLRCEIEPSVKVSGNTVVMHKFELQHLDQYSSSESLSFRFKADYLPYGRKSMALLYVASSEKKDYIIVTLDSSGNVMLETNQGVGIYRMKVTGDFGNGKPHDFVYTRHSYTMSVKVKPLDEYGNAIVDKIEEQESKNPDYPLNSIDTIQIGGYVSDVNRNQFTHLQNFSGCISNTAYIPKATSSVTLRTLRDLYLNVTGINVRGDETQSCSTSHIAKPTTTEAPSKRVTPRRFMDLTMPPWKDKNVRVVTIGTAPTQKSPSTTMSTTTTTRRYNDTFAGVYEEDVEPEDDLFIIIIVSVIAAILILSLCIILIVVRKKKRNGDYDVKKDGDGEFELRQPLNHDKKVEPDSSPFLSNTLPESEQQNHKNNVPNDHLAKLDEFSMITALLGPRAPKEETEPPDAAKQRYGKGNYPLTEDEVDFINPIYNARKQRPASSISEVLEELERRQVPARNSPEETAKRSHGEGEMEWDPQADTSTPVTYEDISFFNAPLLAPIPDELEESHLSSFSGQPSSFGGESYQKADTFEGSNSPHGSSHMNSTTECNGDSGYEAESRPEITEEDISPETNDEDGDFSHKLFSFHVADLQSDSSPNLSGFSAKEQVYEGTSV